MKLLKKITIEDLAQFVVKSTLEHHVKHGKQQLSDDSVIRYTEIISSRLGLAGSLPMTLEKSAKLFDLTRERVRQITEIFYETQNSLPAKLSIGEKYAMSIIDEVQLCKNSMEAIDALELKGYFRGRKLTLEEIGLLLEWTNSKVVASRWKHLENTWLERESSLELFTSAALALRSKYDFLEISILRSNVANAELYTDNEIVETLRQNNRVGFSNGWIFIPRSFPNRAESSIFNQLLIAHGNCLRNDEAWEGLRREALGRTVSIPPSHNAVLESISQASDAVSVLNGISQLDKSKIDSYIEERGAYADSTMTKFVEAIKNSPTSCMHRYETINWAIKNGFKPSTIGQYSRFDERIREDSNSVLYIVGNKPSDEELELKSDSIRIQFEDVEYSTMLPALDGFILKIDPRWILSGRVHISNSFCRAHIGNYVVNCFCGNSENNASSIGDVEVLANGVIRPSARIVNHLVDEHRILPGKEFKLLFRSKHVVLTFV